MIGIVIGVLLVNYSISFTAIVFSGEFAILLPRAFGIGLFSAMVMAAITSLTASYPGSIGGPQDATAAVLAIAIGSAAASLPQNASPEGREQPALMATFHRFMARRYSQKLADSNRMLEAVLRQIPSSGVFRNAVC